MCQSVPSYYLECDTDDNKSCGEEGDLFATAHNNDYTKAPRKKHEEKKKRFESRHGHRGALVNIFRDLIKRKH